MAKTPKMLPTVKIGKSDVTRLIIGGNPISGFSHQTQQRDLDFITYYSAANVLKMWDTAWKNGVNTIQCRGDRHIQRLYIDHRNSGGKMQWIAQTASELSNIVANIAQIAKIGPIAIYNHGTHTDHHWHQGTIEKVRDHIKAIHDNGLPAGIGTHIPEIVRYAEEHGWETDFYMCSLYNLSKTEKQFVASATNQGFYATEVYDDADRDAMTDVIRQVKKPCLAFKILAAGRNTASPDTLHAAFEYACSHIKPTDAVVVGVFQRDKDEVAENARIVRNLLGG